MAQEQTKKAFSVHITISESFFKYPYKVIKILKL